MRIFFVVFSAWYLLGCTSTATVLSTPVLTTPNQLPHGAVDAVVVVPANEIFALNSDAKAFVDGLISQHSDERAKMRALAYGILSHTELGLLYEAHANNIAQDTFVNRAANCLSLTIMTYAMAQHAGFKTKFNEVLVPEYWTLSQGQSLINGHVNVSLSPFPSTHLQKYLLPVLTVDFDPEQNRSKHPSKVIDKAHITAMFYNNVGAQALVNEEYAKAYAHFVQAVRYAPNFADVFINLGVLYRRLGMLDEAEAMYQHALLLVPDKLTALENYAVLLSVRGETNEADRLRQRVERLRQDNPHYHAYLGLLAFEAGDYAASTEHYQRASRLLPTHHVFYHRLAVNFAMLGNDVQSDNMLKKALRLAPDWIAERKYQSKIAALNL